MTRIVMITPTLPYDGVPHAGGRYLRELLAVLCSSGADVDVIAADNPANRGAARTGTAPAHHIAALTARNDPGSRALRFFVHNGDRLLRRLDEGLPPLALGAGTACSATLRQIVADADVLDLQWSESIRLLPILRRLNRRARTIGTFHDVPSQMFDRVAAQPTDPGHRRWALAARHARHLERRAVRRLDDVVTFSAKDDAVLAPGVPRSTTIIRPPLASSAQSPRRAPTGKTVVFVGYWLRPENADGARWLLREVWPRVLVAHPDARLELVGLGMPDDVAAMGGESVRVRGYVDDLQQVYACASAAVIPLLAGAGVKFKAIEALAAGVPCISTPIGAEGIAGEPYFARVTSDPVEFAAAVLAVLDDPSHAETGARAAQRWVAKHYGAAQFEHDVRGLYLPGHRA